MKRFLAASVMVLSIVSFACDRDDGQTAGEQVESAAKQTGEALDTAAERTGEALGKVTDKTIEAAKDASADVQRATTQVVPGDAQGIYEVLEDATEAATNPGGFDELVRRLTAADRARIGEDYAAKDWPDFDDMAAKVQAKWKETHGGKLDLDEKAVFGIVPVTLDSGGNSATVAMPSAGAGAAVTVKFRKEADGWRIDAPDTLSGEGLKNALIARFNGVLQGNPPIAGDAVAAQRTMAAVVMGAIGS